ncbi:MAG TPA: transcription termination/antitermination NusG family protein [Xanthobacteraceae bacterium]|jgi:transcription elongation factor/antiterminator RfaH
MQRLIRGNEVVSDSASKGETVSERKLPANSAPCVVTDNGCLRWYAVHTQPNRELRAKSQLENQGYEVFLPRCLKTVRHARKLTNVAAPFFPRYLFVRLDLVQHRWRSVNGTFGVISLVMQGEKPHPVPRGVVEAMIASVDTSGFLCFKESLVLGTQVRLAAGPFAEQLGILDRLDDSGRVRVLLDIMGAAIPVYVERKFVVTA